MGDEIDWGDYGPNYMDELKAELEQLKIDQEKFPTEYKTDRIKKLEDRLGITAL